MASIFAFAWTYSVCASINLTLRAVLAESHIPLTRLRVWASLSRRAPDMSLPWVLLLATGLFWAVGLLPTWLWTGALTPQIVSWRKYGSVSAPRVGNGSYPFLLFTNTSQNWINCHWAVQSNGTFDLCPGRTQSGRIIDSISTASSSSGNARNHSKLDNSGYNYINRSYGVGVSAGLEQFPQLVGLNNYIFSELAYQTTATCTYNLTSNWTLSANQTDYTSAPIPNLFNAIGRLPNEDWTAGVPEPGYGQWSFGLTPSTITSLAAGSCCGFKNGT